MAAPTSEHTRIFAEAGFEEGERAYAAAKGLVSSRHLVRIAASEAEYVDAVVRPFIEGIEIGGTRHKAAGATLARTRLLVAFDLATNAVRAASQAATAPVPAFPVIPAQPQPVAGPTTSSSTILTNADWLAGVDRYKAHWHPPKRFETQELLGAEKTLARACYEFVTTKAFTPVGLTNL